MPKFPKSLEPRKPRRAKQAPPPSREALMRSALASVLRRLGLVSHVVPTDLALLALARDFSAGGKGLADDRGAAVDVKPFADCLSPPDPFIDEEIPF